AFLTFRALAKRPDLHRGVLHVSPAQARFLLREGIPAPAGLDIVSVGAGLCDPDELARLADRLPGGRLFVTYGLTEAGPRVTTGRFRDPDSAHAGRRGYVGRALPGVVLLVEPDDGGPPSTSGTGQL